MGRKNVIRSSLPLTHNGFIITGKDEKAPDPEYPYLVVLDFDNKNPGKIFSFLYKTFQVKTGSNGAHLYFWTNKPFNNSQNKPITNKSKKLGLKGFDIRGKGGIIFAPGCKFTDHQNSYSILQNIPIHKIDSIKLQTYIDKFIWEPFESYNCMREGFKQIMCGDFELWSDVNKKTGISEWLYWSAFWREFLNCGGTIEEGIAHFKRTKLQKDFQDDETRRQLSSPFHHDSLNKRPSNDFYARLFPELKDEIKYNNGDLQITNNLEERFQQLEKKFLEIQKQFSIVLKKFPKRRY